MEPWAIPASASVSVNINPDVPQHTITPLQFQSYQRPIQTHTVNIAGSFVLGAISVTSGLDPRLKLMVGTGFCGALTTFSTFSVDTVRAGSVFGMTNG